jgi:hypothetical protein
MEVKTTKTSTKPFAEAKSALLLCTKIWMPCDTHQCIAKAEHELFPS